MSLFRRRPAHVRCFTFRTHLFVCNSNVKINCMTNSKTSPHSRIYIVCLIAKSFQNFIELIGICDHIVNYRNMYWEDMLGAFEFIIIVLWIRKLENNNTKRLGTREGLVTRRVVVHSLLKFAWYSRSRKQLKETERLLFCVPIYCGRGCYLRPQVIFRYPLHQALNWHKMLRYKRLSKNNIHENKLRRDSTHDDQL